MTRGVHVLNACDGHDSRTRTHKPAQSTCLCAPPRVGFNTRSLFVGFQKCSLDDTGWQRRRGCLIFVGHSPQKRRKIELDLTCAASLAGTLHGLPMCPSKAGEGKAAPSTPVCVPVNVFAWVRVCLCMAGNVRKESFLSRFTVLRAKSFSPLVLRGKSLFSFVLPVLRGESLFSLVLPSCAKRVFSLSFCAKRVFSLWFYRAAKTHRIP